MYRQTLKVEIKRILYLIEHMVRLDIETDQFMKQMAKCLNYKLSDQEISNYVAWYDTEESEDLGLTKADGEVAREILEEFRTDYLQNKKD